MEYYSAIKKNSFKSVLMRCMKLEPIIQCEVSQKDKDQYSILMHIYGIKKDGNDNPICKTISDTEVENRLLDSVGEGERGMFWENSIETNILSNVKQIASPGWMHETSAQGWCTGKTRGMEWGGRWERGSGWGTHENPWLIHVNVWQKPLQYSKIISLQLIKINEKKSSCLSPTEIGWNLGPFAAVLEPGQMSLQATKYKETSETKI